MTTYHFDDLEEINVPIMFLDEHTSDRLRVHDGPIQYLSYYGDWITLSCEPGRYPGAIYRAAPVPKTKPAPPVEHLADWIKWWARYEDGTVFGYEEKPLWVGESWVWVGGRCNRLCNVLKFDVGTCDAKDSRVCRADVITAN